MILVEHGLGGRTLGASSVPQIQARSTSMLIGCPFWSELALSDAASRRQGAASVEKENWRMRLVVQPEPHLKANNIQGRSALGGTERPRGAAPILMCKN